MRVCSKSLDEDLPTINKIVVVGDTGCRVGHQLCDHGNWPLETIAAFAADKKPDAVIHVGDYLYRECPHKALLCAEQTLGVLFKQLVVRPAQLTTAVDADAIYVKLIRIVLNIDAQETVAHTSCDEAWSGGSMVPVDASLNPLPRSMSCSTSFFVLKCCVLEKLMPNSSMFRTMSPSIMSPLIVTFVGRDTATASVGRSHA